MCIGAGPSVILLACLMVIVGVGGCQRFDDSYGDTRGTSANESLNGFGTMRRIISQRLYDRDDGDSFTVDEQDIVALGQRTMDVDAIVWTPARHSGIANPTRMWMERWLASGQKTLVYVVPDQGSMDDYLRRAIQTGPPESRLEYRRQLARRSLERLANDKSVVTDQWFGTRPSRGWLSDQSMVGPWAGRRDGSIKFRPSMVITEIVPADDEGESWAGESAQWETLIAVEDGPLVVRLRHDRWKDSQVILVGGGSLVTNYAIVAGAGQTIASRIGEAMVQTAIGMEDDRVDSGETELVVAFSTTPGSSLPVRQRPPQQPVASGMDVLTTWPLSLVTIHGLIAGLIGCLIAFPIFGRPRRSPSPDPSRFSDHIDAVANLLGRTSDETFASDRLRRYRRQIRGEES